MQKEKQIIQRINYLWKQIEKDKNVLTNAIAIRELFNVIDRKELVQHIPEPEEPLKKTLLKQELQKIVKEEIQEARRFKG